MIDWKKKLSSRKFWAAVALFISGLVTFIASPSTSPEAITGLIMEAGAVVAYIVGEGFADGKGADSVTMINPDDLVYNSNPAGYECTSEDGVAADDEEFDA